MKKSLILLSILSVATAFVGCNNLDPIDDPRGGNSELLPQTEVFFHGQKLAYEGQKPQAAAKAKIKIMETAGGLAWPKHTDEGWESARFSIRVDGKIPDFYDKSSAQYYGRPAGKAGVNSRNINSQK